METYRPKFNYFSLPSASEHAAFEEFKKLMRERPELFIAGAISSSTPRNKSFLGRLIFG